MSLGGELVEALAELVKGIVSGTREASAAERAELAAMLRANADRLEGIEPNLPRIHQLGEEARTRIAEAERLRLEHEGRTERSDEKTVETPIPSGR